MQVALWTPGRCKAIWRQPCDTAQPRYKLMMSWFFFWCGYKRSSQELVFIALLLEWIALCRACVVLIAQPPRVNINCWEEWDCCFPVAAGESPWLCSHITACLKQRPINVWHQSLLSAPALPCYLVLRQPSPSLIHYKPLSFVFSTLH